MASRSDTWSPFQSGEVKDICAHMSDLELRKAEKRAGSYGLWCAFTFAFPLAFIITKPSPVAFVIGSIPIPIHIGYIPLWFRSQRRFLCQTEWARQKGFAPGNLKLFSFRKRAKEV